MTPRDQALLGLVLSVTSIICSLVSLGILAVRWWLR